MGANKIPKDKVPVNLDKFIQERSEELDQRRGTQYEVENAAGWFIHCLQDQLKGI